jgi:hypothetical protein
VGEGAREIHKDVVHVDVEDFGHDFVRLFCDLELSLTIP